MKQKFTPKCATSRGVQATQMCHHPAIPHFDPSQVYLSLKNKANTWGSLMGSKKRPGEEGKHSCGERAATFPSINIPMAATPSDFRVNNRSDKSLSCVFPEGSRVFQVFPGTCTAQALECGISIPLEEAMPGAAALQGLFFTPKQLLQQVLLQMNSWFPKVPAKLSRPCHPAFPGVFAYFCSN